MIKDNYIYKKIGYILNKNRLHFKQKYKKDLIYRFGDYFIYFNQCFKNLKIQSFQPITNPIWFGLLSRIAVEPASNHWNRKSNQWTGRPDWFWVNRTVRKRENHLTIHQLQKKYEILELYFFLFNFSVKWEKILSIHAFQ